MVNIADRIREMSKYCNDNAIAAALNIPVEIISGILSGQIADEDLAGYDPASPREIRIVEQKQFLRSKTVGVVSAGGCGATTIAAALALTLSKGQQTAVTDLNEYGYLTSLLKVKNLSPTILGWARGSSLDFVSVPVKETLDAFLAVSSIKEYFKVMPGSLGTLIRAAGSKYALTIFDCPGSPPLWDEVFNELDTIFWVIRADTLSLKIFPKFFEYIEPFKNKTFLLFNMLKNKRTVSQCKAAAERLGLPVIEFIPFISGLEVINKSNAEKILCSNLAPRLEKLIAALNPVRKGDLIVNR